jgi:hypothetical protein
MSAFSNEPNKVGTSHPFTLIWKQIQYQTMDKAPKLSKSMHYTQSSELVAGICSRMVAIFRKLQNTEEQLVKFISRESMHTHRYILCF